MLNWDSGLDWKLLTTKYRHLEGFIGIARDRDTGRIYRDASCGKPRIAYSPSKLDKAHCLKGVVEMCKMTLTGGAREIHVAIAGTTPYLVDALDENPSIADPRFVEWLDGVVKAGNEPPGGIFPSAHQMGSNRMAYRADMGVVDPKGKVWGTEGCFVADASVFPSASGVNPMVTNMAISDMISRGIAQELDVEKGRISRL
jgi:choline dehydrogenase-like flavoprotein